MWTQFNQSLIQLKESQEIDVKLISDSFDNKTKDLNQLIKDIKKCNKEKERLELELEVVEKAITKANSNITKAENKCLEIQEYIDKLSKKSDENKENVENVMNVWNTIGLRVEKKDNIHNIKFNKISETDPNKWFSVRVQLEDEHRIRIIDCDPKQSLDSKLIEDQFNGRSKDSKLDFRHLIAFIRIHLKRNNSK